MDSSRKNSPLRFPNSALPHACLGTVARQRQVEFGVGLPAVVGWMISLREDLRDLWGQGLEQQVGNGVYASLVSPFRNGLLNVLRQVRLIACE